MTRPAEPRAFRPLREGDASLFSDAFAAIGWRKPAAMFLQYVAEADAGTRTCWVAEEQSRLAGYVTVRWPPGGGDDEAEIQDLNVLPPFRGRGIGTALLAQAEAAAAARGSSLVQIAVGLHRGYGAAQRLYVQRGYVPDARGVSIRGRQVAEGETVVVDDDLVLTLQKVLRAGSRG